MMNTQILYIGSCTGTQTRGIYTCRFDCRQGSLTAARRVAEAISPFFLAAHPNGRFLYAVSDNGNKTPNETGTIQAFSIHPDTGDLTFLNKVSTGGNVPCYIAIDKLGRCALVANYGTSTVATFPINPDGRLSHTGMLIQHSGSSVHPARQQESHPHAIILDTNNTHALSADLGTDKIRLYRFDAKHGTLVQRHQTSFLLAPGSGPRHLVFHPNGRWVYVINELADTVTVLAYNPKEGQLSLLQTLDTIPKECGVATYASEIQIHPSGRYLYCSNRGHDSLAIFAIDSKSGLLTLLDTHPCGGNWPRCFCIDPTGQWLLTACERSDRITVFKINPENGKLSTTEGGISLPTPGSMQFCPKSA